MTWGQEVAEAWRDAPDERRERMLNIAVASDAGERDEERATRKEARERLRMLLSRRASALNHTPASARKRSDERS